MHQFHLTCTGQHEEERAAAVQVSRATRREGLGDNDLDFVNFLLFCQHSKKNAVIQSITKRGGNNEYFRIFPLSGCQQN